MSKYYGQTWQFAGYSKIYIEPKSFTDNCQNPNMHSLKVPNAFCNDHSNCVSIVENLQIG